MNSWAWISASSRGTSHERTGTRLQDASSSFVVHRTSGDVFTGIVCDGAGSAEFGGQGASLVSRSLTVEIRSYLAKQDSLPTAALVEEWIDAARDRLFAVAQRRGKVPRDFAATLLCVVSDANNAVIAHIGDGCIVIKEEATGSWTAPIWPDHGEYASTTSFVTDEPTAQLRFNHYAGSITALALFSDGLERLALDLTNYKPFEPFLNGMHRPLLGISEAGRSKEMSKRLKDYLNSPPVNSRTDDDKTLILAVRV